MGRPLSREFGLVDQRRISDYLHDEYVAAVKARRERAAALRGHSKDMETATARIREVVNRKTKPAPKANAAPKKKAPVKTAPGRKGGRRNG